MATEVVPTVRLDPVVPGITGLYLGVDFEDACARIWGSVRDYTLNMVLRPLPSTGDDCQGFEYKATTVGSRGSKEPAWPVLEGGVVKDGSAVLTAQKRSSASLVRSVVGTPTWSEITSIITFNDAAIDGKVAVAYADLTNAVDGTDYVIVCRATLTDGTTQTGAAVAFVLPVRLPE